MCGTLSGWILFKVVIMTLKETRAEEYHMIFGGD